MLESSLSSEIPALHFSKKSQIFSPDPIQIQQGEHFWRLLTYGSFSIRRCCALQSTFQNICRCADCGCNGPRSQRRRNVDRNSIRNLYDFVRENLLLRRRVSGFRLASSNKCVQQAYTAICETSCSNQSTFLTRMGFDSLIKMLLTTFGPKPFVKVFSPSSLPIRTNPRIAFE
jgi:hypothetical protein